MFRVRFTKCLVVIGAFAAAQPAFAQQNSAIPDYRQDLFQNCIAGNDVGALTKVSNPLLLIGSVTYAGNIMMPGGQTAKGWMRQPMALPIVTAESVSPDQVTCSYTFEATTDGNISVLGFAIGAGKSDIYKMNVRLIARQNIAPVAENSNQVQPWHSTRYKDQFKAIVQSLPNVSTFFIFDNISIYLLQVEKYKKQSAGLAGALGFFSGGANYKRDETFAGTKLIVTGDPVELPRTMFATPTPPVAMASVPGVAPVALRTLTEAEATALESTLQQVSRRQ